MSFSPDPVVIDAGQKIAWRNDDTLVHTATGEDRNGFDTREIAPVHPTMVGTLTVR